MQCRIMEWQEKKNKLNQQKRKNQNKNFLKGTSLCEILLIRLRLGLRASPIKVINCQSVSDNFWFFSMRIFFRRLFFFLFVDNIHWILSMQINRYLFKMPWFYFCLCFRTLLMWFCFERESFIFNTEINKKKLMTIRRPWEMLWISCAMKNKKKQYNFFVLSVKLISFIRIDTSKFVHRIPDTIKICKLSDLINSNCTLC